MSRSSGAPGAVPARLWLYRPTWRPQAQRPGRRAARDHRLGRGARRRRRLRPAWPTSRFSAGREGHSPRSGFLRRVDHVLRPPRHHRRACPDRQRIGSYMLRHPRDRLPHPPASATSAPAPTDPDQRQSLCLSVGVPSGWAARLPAPAGLTQAKGMPVRSLMSERSGLNRRAALACVRFVDGGMRAGRRS